MEFLQTYNGGNLKWIIFLKYGDALLYAVTIHNLSELTSKTDSSSISTKHDERLHRHNGSKSAISP